MVTTSGSTRAITLQKDFDEMLYFNIGSMKNINSLPIRDVTFTPPNKVTFVLKVLLNGTITDYTDNEQHGYVFIGK